MPSLWVRLTWWLEGNLCEFCFEEHAVAFVGKPICNVCSFKYLPTGRSSNGRTRDFESLNEGSTPSLPSKKEGGSD